MNAPLSFVDSTGRIGRRLVNPIREFSSEHLGSFAAGRGVSVLLSVVAAVDNQAMIVADGHGNVGLLTYNGFGSAGPQVTANRSIAVFGGIESIHDLGYSWGQEEQTLVNAFGGNVGGGFTWGVNASGGVIFNNDGINGISANTGIGIGLPVDVYATMGVATIYQITNVFDIAESLIDIISIIIIRGHGASFMFKENETNCN
jgi:hypothetical protein